MERGPETNLLTPTWNTNSQQLILRCIQEQPSSLLWLRKAGALSRLTRSWYVLGGAKHIRQVQLSSLSLALCCFKPCTPSVTASCNNCWVIAFLKHKNILIICSEGEVAGFLVWIKPRNDLRITKSIQNLYIWGQISCKGKKLFLPCD